jgi:hypothetical protein
MTVGRLTWVVGPSDTSQIPAGTYSVTAVLDTTTSAGNTGWQGITASPLVSVQVGAPPSPLSLDQQEQQAGLLAKYDHLLNNDTQALADLTSFLNQQPNSIGALTFRGSLLAETGQLSDALNSLNQALTAFYVANPAPVSEDPVPLIVAQAKVQSQLMSQTGPACATDVSSSIAVTRSGYTYNFATQRFSQTVKLTNTSGAPISGPFNLVLDSLSSNAALFNAAGLTSCAVPGGSPFVTSNTTTLAPGATVSVVLQFTNASRAVTSYTTRVLAGPAAP